MLAQRAPVCRGRSSDPVEVGVQRLTGTRHCASRPSGIALRCPCFAQAMGGHPCDACVTLACAAFNYSALRLALRAAGQRPRRSTRPDGQVVARTGELVSALRLMVQRAALDTSPLNILSTAGASKAGTLAVKAAAWRKRALCS